VREYSRHTSSPVCRIRTEDLLARYVKPARHRDGGMHVETTPERVLAWLFRFAQYVERSKFNNSDRYIRILQKPTTTISVRDFSLEFRLCAPNRSDNAYQRHRHIAGRIDVILAGERFFPVDRLS